VVKTLAADRDDHLFDDRVLAARAGCDEGFVDTNRLRHAGTAASRTGRSRGRVLRHAQLADDAARAVTRQMDDKADVSMMSGPISG
jgi:hypothetical protein